MPELPQPDSLQFQVYFIQRKNKRRRAAPEPEPSEWLMADGEWNDAGKWDDLGVWNDG